MQSKSLITHVFHTRIGTKRTRAKINLDRNYRANKDNVGNVLICANVTTDPNNDNTNNIRNIGKQRSLIISVGI